MLRCIVSNILMKKSFSTSKNTFFYSPPAPKLKFTTAEIACALKIDLSNISSHYIFDRSWYIIYFTFPKADTAVEKNMRKILDAKNIEHVYTSINKQPQMIIYEEQFDEFAEFVKTANQVTSKPSVKY